MLVPDLDGLEGGAAKLSGQPAHKGGIGLGIRRRAAHAGVKAGLPGPVGRVDNAEEYADPPPTGCIDNPAQLAKVDVTLGSLEDAPFDLLLDPVESHGGRGIRGCINAPAQHVGLDAIAEEARARGGRRARDGSSRCGRDAFGRRLRQCGHFFFGQRLDGLYRATCFNQRPVYPAQVLVLGQADLVPIPTGILGHNRQRGTGSHIRQHGIAGPRPTPDVHPFRLGHGRRFGDRPSLSVPHIIHGGRCSRLCAAITRRRVIIVRPGVCLGLCVGVSVCLGV